MQQRVLGVLLAATAALAKTDIGGCVSSATVKYGGASLIWYVPDTGEICELLDCGGGRAPPKTTVPGCPQYEGTETYSPNFLPGFGAEATSTDANSAAATATSSGTSSDSDDSNTEIAPASTSTTAAETGSDASSDNVTSSSSGTKALETGTGILTAAATASTGSLVTAPPGSAVTPAPSTGGAASSNESENGESADAGSSSVPEAAAATVGPRALGVGIAALGIVAGMFAV